MTVVNPKSISGITSITTASGSDNLLTIHTSDANNTERFRIDSTGSVKVGSGITLSPDGDGFFTGITTAKELDVIASSVSRTWTPATSNTGLFERNGINRIAIVASSSSQSQLDFADADDDNAGYIRYDHSDNNMSFRTNGSESFRINQDGKVGIGTTNPTTYKLHLQGSTSALARFERTGGAFAKVDIKAGTTAGNSYLTFSDSAASEVGEINYEHADDSLRINTNSAERFRIDSQGRVGIGGSSLSGKLEVRDNAALGILISSTNTQTTDVNKAIRVRNNSDTDTFYVSHKGKVYAADNILMASGKGIDFSATSDASGTGASAGSELFDDYEEGTWVPTVTQGTIAYETANYVKIGRLVHLSARVQTFSDRSSTNNISVGGIPFAVQDATNIGTGVYYRVARTDQGHIGTMVTGSDKVQFLVSSQGGSESWFYLQHADLNSSGSQVRFNVWYIT